MKKDGIIYCIENKLNGKKYIGKTIIPLLYRWSKHRSDSLLAQRNCNISKAIREFGSNQFNIYELEKCSYDILSDRETHWIKELDTMNNGYNQIISSFKDKFILNEILDCWMNGETITSLSKRFNCCRKTIASFIKKSGYDSRINALHQLSDIEKKNIDRKTTTFGTNKHSLLNQSKYEKAKMMYLSGIPIRQIVKDIKMCRKTLKVHFERENIIILPGLSNRYNHPYKLPLNSSNSVKLQKLDNTEPSPNGKV
jgi:hypothetical protein